MCLKKKQKMQIWNLVKITDLQRTKKIRENSSDNVPDNGFLSTPSSVFRINLFESTSNFFRVVSQIYNFIFWAINKMW